MTVQIKYPNENIENPNNDEELKVVKEELNKEKQKNQVAMMGLMEVNNRLRALEGK